MKRFICAGVFLILWTCLSASCTSMKRTEHLKNPTQSSFYPMTIQAIEAVCIDTLPSQDQGHYTYRDGRRHISGPTYVYEVFISVNLPYADMIWDQPFYIEIDLPTGGKREVAFNEECDRLYGDLQNDFGFLLKTTKKGLSQFTLGFMDETDEIQYDFYNPFRSKEVRLN